MAKIEGTEKELADEADRLTKLLEKELNIDPIRKPIKHVPPMGGVTGSAGMAPPPPYMQLARILELAFKQASEGKGKERHAHGPTGEVKPWHKQPILEIGRMVGTGYAAGQVQKKVQEACTMVSRQNFSGAKAEALGAIVYASALFKLIEETERASITPE